MMMYSSKLPGQSMCCSSVENMQLGMCNMGGAFLASCDPKHTVVEVQWRGLFGLCSWRGACSWTSAVGDVQSRVMQ